MTNIVDINPKNKHDESLDGKPLPIILASTSPRRKKLLASADVDFEAMSVDIDESVGQHESPQDYIQRMVQCKAIAACNQLIKDQLVASGYPKLVITADTIGVLPDGVSILVKPIDKADAIRMWTKMSGKSHSVWTAVQLSLVNASGNIIHTQIILERTTVEFVRLISRQMETYWSSGEPQDKAGGYAIQGKGAAWVSRINGSYTNVVGLPLAQTLMAIDSITHKANQHTMGVYSDQV